MKSVVLKHVVNAVIGFLLAALIVALFAYSAKAQRSEFFDGPPVQIFEDPGPNDDWYARIVIFNYKGSGDFTSELETMYGPVLVEYDTTSGTQYVKEHMDVFKVLEMPIGVRAEPEREILIMEDTSRTIYLYPYLGG